MPEIFERSSFSDWCLVAFICALAVLGYFQYKTMDSQLNVAQNDERAWIRVKPTTNEQSQFIEGQKFAYSLTLSNIGKTPARNIHVNALMNMVPANQQVDLRCADSRCASDSTFYGIFFPNETSPFPMEKFHGETAGHIDAWNNGTAYFAVHGIVTYTDVFHTDHWTKILYLVCEGREYILRTGVH